MEEVHPAVQQNQEEKGRCYVCAEQLVITPSYKTKRLKLNNRLKVKYHSCNKFLCKEHYHSILCHNCQKE